MRTDQHLRVELNAGILSVTLARADKKNALTQSMYLAFGDALEHAMADSSIHVVLVDSDGADFSAGNDIADFVALAQSGVPLENSAVFRFLRLLAVFAKPMVAAVRGRAVGIGTTLLLHCDLVYVASDAKLSTPFVDVALLPEAGSVARWQPSGDSPTPHCLHQRSALGRVRRPSRWPENPRSLCC
jgi:enoyl-CoA hydratase/carnithine racemase